MKGFFSGAVGSIFYSSIRCSNNKVKFIISSIIVFVIMAIMLNNEEIFEQNFKVENVAREYVENKGYDITSEDFVLTSSDWVRNKPVKLWFIRGKADDDWRLVRELELIYNNGKIIGFKEGS